MRKKKKRPEKKIQPRDGKESVPLKLPVLRKSFGRRG